MLTTKNISVRFGDLEVLRDVSIDIAPHSLNILIGPNGTGKSSLLKALAGLIPSSGTVLVDNVLLSTASERSEQIAYMQQDIGPTSSLTVFEVVLLGRVGRLGLSIPREFRNDATDMLTHLGIIHLAHRTLAELSGGQRQLVYVAQSLFRRPKVLLLDEPTAALDLRHQLLVIDAVCRYASETGAVVVAAMHDLTLCARFADRVLCLNNGCIIDDGVPSAVLTSNNIEALYGVTVRVKSDEEGYLSIVPLGAVGPKDEAMKHAI